MLNGKSPLLVFQFPTILKIPGFDPLAGIPLIGAQLAAGLAIPIPILLDEKLTGVYVQDESKAIDIETNVQQTNNGTPPIVDQRGVSSLVTINMLAQKDSLVLTILLALIDIVFARVVSKEYSVSYFNGATTVLGGLLHGFQANQGADDDLYRLTLQLSKANLASTAANVVTVLPKITGAIPVAG